MARELGDKLGPRIARLVLSHQLAARRALAPHEARVSQAAAQALIDRAGHETADLIRPIVNLLTDDELEAMHPALAEFLGKVKSGRHQWQALAGTLGGLSQGVLSQVLGNALAPVAYRINELGPALVADPGTQAAMWAAGLKDVNSAETAGQWQGIRGGELALMELLAETIPGEFELWSLVNRGEMSETEAEQWLHRGKYPAAVRSRIMSLREVLLSPADLSLAVLRGEMSAGEGAAIAAKSGVSAADFNILTLNTGEPPAIESLLEAHRRGFIDTARLVRGIRQSRVRNEWADVIEALAFSPMSTADAVEAFVQGHLSEAESRAKASQNGLEAADWLALSQTAGEPLSRTEMEQLFNRGKTTRADVEQALRESRLKNKYIPLAFDLHERLPEPRQIVSGLTHGALTKPQAARLLAEWGFSAENAAILIAEGSNARLAVHHALTLAEIRQLYSEGIFTRAHAEELLHGMGYDPPDTAALIASWDLLAGAAVTRQAVGVVRSRFVSRRFDEKQAVLYLDSLNIPAGARTHYLQVWTLEREATAAVLTEAQIVSAHKKALITGPEALSRLMARGYVEGDAKILLGVKPSDPVPK